MVQEYTRDVGMEFGIDKCAVLITIQKGLYGDDSENEQLWLLVLLVVLDLCYNIM